MEANQKELLAHLPVRDVANLFYMLGDLAVMTSRILGGIATAVEEKFAEDEAQAGQAVGK